MQKHFKCKNCGNTDFTQYDNKSYYYCNVCNTNIEVIYEFLYNPNTCESVSHTVSIHKTKKGAEMAMEFHKNEKLKEWENNQRENKKYGIKEDSFPWHFDQWWGISETQLQE